MLFSPPLWGLALGLLSAPWRYARRMARTLYFLTDQRAVVFEQLTLWRNRCVWWPLFPGLIKKKEKSYDGSGNLIFDYEVRWVLQKGWRKAMPVGFIAVPQFEQVRQLEETQMAAVPAGCAPFAYRPDNLCGPSPNLDPWGNPAPNQPQQQGNGGPPLIPIGILFSLFASVFVAIGCSMLHTEHQLAEEGVETTATVLNVRESRSSGGRRGGGLLGQLFPTAALHYKGTGMIT